jgi:hypothetical protein
VGTLIGMAENLKNLEKKISQGGSLTKEDTAGVKAITGELLFGYNEQERIRLLNEVYKEVQKQINEIT